MKKYQKNKGGLKMLKDLIKKNRSYRRFYENKKISKKTLREIIDLARLSASAANRQPLKYIITTSKEVNKKIFKELSWAGYISDWDGPQKGERPAAYITILGDKDITKNYWDDPGIAAQSILLGAVEKNLGGCILGAINKENIRIKLNIPEKFQILYVIALGKPKEKVVIDSSSDKGDIKYWRDENKVHHVPKRDLSEIIIKEI